MYTTLPLFLRECLREPREQKPQRLARARRGVDERVDERRGLLRRVGQRPLGEEREHLAVVWCVYTYDRVPS